MPGVYLSRHSFPIAKKKSSNSILFSSFLLKTLHLIPNNEFHFISNYTYPRLIFSISGRALNDHRVALMSYRCRLVAISKLIFNF